MPIYEYKCACGFVSEFLYGTKPLFKTCRKCGAALDEDDRIISLSHFSFPSGLPSLESDPDIAAVEEE